MKEYRHVHPIQPRRLIARVFFYAGLIEQWGSGIGRIIRAVRESGLPEPAFEESGGFRVVFRKAKTPQVTPHDTPHDAILKFCLSPKSRDEIMETLALKDRKHLREKYIAPLLRKSLLRLTIPGKPQSKMQRYVTTDRGRNMCVRKR